MCVPCCQLIQKGAILTHGNLISTCSSLNLRLRTQPQQENESVLSYLPLAHIYERLIESSIIMEGHGIGFFQGVCLSIVPLYHHFFYRLFRFLSNGPVCSSVWVA